MELMDLQKTLYRYTPTYSLVIVEVNALHYKTKCSHKYTKTNQMVCSRSKPSSYCRL